MARGRIQFSAAQRRWIVAEYRAGRSPASIGRELGRNVDTVRRVLGEEGVLLRGRAAARRGKPPANKFQPTPEQLRSLIAAHDQGEPLAAIGALVGLTGQGVRRVLSDHGVDTRRKSALDADQRAEVVARYHAGESRKALARAFGVSPPTIKRALLEAGVRLRTQSEAARGKRAHNRVDVDDETAERIRVLWEQEYLAAHRIAAEVGGLSTPVVQRLIKERGFRKPGMAERRAAAARDTARRLEQGLAARARRLFGEGCSTREIAVQLDLPVSDVRTVVGLEHGRDYGANLSLAVRRDLLASFDRRPGFRAADLARKHGIASSQTVISFLNNRGVDTSPGRRFVEEESERIVELHAQGLGTVEIAALLASDLGEAVDDHLVRHCLKEAKVRLSSYTTTIPHRSRYAGEIIVRGGWEKDVAKHLDKRVERGEIGSWAYGGLTIPYEHLGRRRTYFPDFIVTTLEGEEEIWEVKGRWFDGTDPKIDAARSLGYKVEVVHAGRMPEIWADVVPEWDWEWQRDTPASG